MSGVRSVSEKENLLKVLKELQFWCQGVLWYNQNDYYPENNLAKFAYILDMKKEKKKQYY
jgi:hypothetical protein